MVESDAKHPTATVYFNGQLHRAAEARLPIDDRGVLFGLGFFESFRTRGGRPHHWIYHRRRLEAACATAGLVLPEEFLARDETRLRAAVAGLLHANGAADAVFRYTVTAGPAGGLPAEFLVMRPLPQAAPEGGVALRVLSLRRDGGEWQPRPKSLNYANALLGAAELERRTAVASDEGLFLSRDGFVVETPRQAIAWIAEGRLCYPDLALGSVAGTCLAWVLERASAAEPRCAPLGELLKAEAIFVLNAVRGITPVREVWDETDTRRLGEWDSVSHPIVGSLCRQWGEALAATAQG